jgi:60S ribosome subunit biogenesis protein NIP7
LTREERTTLNRAFDTWGVFDFFKEKQLLVTDENPKKVLIVSSAARQFLSRTDLLYAGLVIGDLQKGFTPTIAGADLFARNKKKNDYYVTVNDKAEQLVLYGRDVMGDSLTIPSESLDENQLVIILNSRQEAIGTGRTRFAGKSLLQKGRITITTIADAGKYLRDEG